MNKKIITGILCATLGLTVAAGVGLSVGLRDNGVTAVAEWSGEQLTESYYLGAEFVMPEAKLTVGNKTVDADVALLAPDGSATRAEKTVLNQIGTYVLQYSAIVDGKPYGKEVSFAVRGDLITYSSETTKITYATSPYSSDAEKEYLTVSIAQGDTLTFSQLIDVATISKDDKLLDFFISPAMAGTADIDELFYMFTDSQNPDIYLKVRLKRYARKSGQAYFLSGGNGQELKGVEGKNIHVNDNYGTPFTKISFDATNAAAIDSVGTPIHADEYGVSFRYDAQERTTYAVNHSGGLSMIVDLDSTQYYEKLWSGFPSGKVKLSMWAQGYNSSAATLCITNVRGIDLSTYGAQFEEKNPPVITVDSDYEVMPEAKLGAAYAIPAAKAVDDYSGECKVDVSVWYNYASSNAVLVDIADGKFNVERKGYYAIVYTAIDRYGNVATKILNVHAGNEIPQIIVEPKFAPAETVVLGEWFEIPSELDIVGGSGNKMVVITASNGGETFVVEKGFRPEKTGNWTITYTATDYVGNVGEYSFTFATELPTAPILVDGIAMPLVYISDQPYVLPEVYANDYRSGALVRALCDVEVTDANGTKTYKAGDTFVPVTSENGAAISFTYKYDGVTLKTLEVPTVFAWVKEGTTKKLQLQNYFYGEGFTTEKTQDGMKLTATQENCGWTFANALVAQGLNVVLVGEQEATTYQGYEMTLTDAGNSANVVRMQVVKKGDVSEFSVYGTDTVLELHGSIDDGDKITLGFANGAFTANGTPIAPVKTVNGESFNGFESEKVFLSVKLIGAEVGATYKVVSINGQPFTTTTRDQVKPNITILGDYGGSYALNTLYTINAAVASDVLSPNVIFKMSVKTPNGGYATDVNGKELRDLDPSITYTINLSEYGQYTIMYTASEDLSFTTRPNGENEPFLCGINVIDMEKPEISFSESFQKTAKVGDILVIPDFVVSDNLTAAEDIVVLKYVCNPYGSIIKLTKGNSIKADYAGVYEFRIVAVDKIGNMQLVSAYVTVTE